MYEFSASGLFHRLFRLCLWAAHLPLLLGVLWVIGFAFCQPIGAAAVIPFIIILIWRRKRDGRAYLSLWTAGFCLIELALFLAIPCTPAEKVLKGLPPKTLITQGENGTFHLTNICDNIYHEDGSMEERELEEDFDPAELTGVYLSECFRGKDSTDCRLLLSFAFRDGRYLVIAPEIRLPLGTTENPVRVHYKNYELVYTFGTEEGVYALNTNYLRYYLTLYPLKADTVQMQQMFARCLELAQQTQKEKRAFHPLAQAYRNDLLSVLCLICPELTKHRLISNANVAKLLYRNGAMLIPEQGDWSVVRRKYALGFNIRPAVREEYSDVIRARIGLPVRNTLPQRTVREAVTDKIPTDKTKHAPHTVSTAADIPEPGARLAKDILPRLTAEQTPQDFTGTQSAEAEEQTGSENGEHTTDITGVLNKDDDASVAAATRELDKNKQMLDDRAVRRARSAADGILEPGARLYADERKEEEEEAAQEERKRRAAAGRDIMEAQGDEAMNKDNTRFSELFFGKRKSGITIIEKAKPKEEAHPLDPVRKQKRVNPFDAEDRKKQEEQQEPQEVDPFAPKKPINI